MLTFTEKMAYGGGAFAKDFAITIVYMFLMIYLTDVHELSPIFVGTLFLVARLWDAFNDPIMGVVIDNTESRWGKFKPWILLGTLLNAVVLVGLFSKPAFVTNMYVYISIMYILWGMTYTLMDIPFWAMLPSVAREQKDRNELASILGIFANGAWLLVGAFGLMFISIFSGGTTDPQQQSQGYFYLSLIIAIIFVSITIGMLFVLKTTSNKGTISKLNKIGFKEAFQIIKENDQLLIYIVFVLVYNLAKGLSANSSIYYFRYVIGNTNLYSFSQGFAGLITIGGLFFFPILTKLVGRKNLFKLGIFIPVLGHIIFGIFGSMFPNSLAIIFIRTVSLGIGDSFILGATIVMIADIVDYGEKKLGTRNESIINSLRTFLIKSASAFNGWFIGLALSLSGFVANQPQNTSTLLSIKMLMYMLPILLLVLCYIFYKKNYKLYNDDDFEMVSSVEKT